ncbi:hypothetical protein F2Q69_00008819 [Brassica cretica]|uniref:Uncharacterized protein n=1 Tax=Brassica cretica TaxID=69181 RepID=A0A8S9PQ09_BRACR|nr:hypothetical protein F2Q69_00008819 [Brassica cretica]
MNILTKISLGIFRGDFRQTSAPRNFLGNVFPIPSEIFEGFPRKEEILRNYFRALVSSVRVSGFPGMISGNPKISSGVRPRTSTAAHVRPRKSIREGQSRAQSCGLSPRPGAVHGLSPSKRRGCLTRRIMVRGNRPERPLRLTHNPRPVPRPGTVRENRSERACSHAQSRGRLTRLPPVRGLAQAMTRTTGDLPKKFGAPKKGLIDGGDASTSNNKNGQAQAKKKVDKGKDVVIEAEDPDHSSSGSEEQVQAKKRKRVATKPTVKVPSATAINNKLRAMKLQPSLFVDEEILEKLGILSDVQLLFGNMELWKMMSTCQR